MAMHKDKAIKKMKQFKRKKKEKTFNTCLIGVSGRDNGNVRERQRYNNEGFISIDEKCQ